MFFSKQNIEAYDNKKIVSLKNIQKVLLKEMALFEDERVKSKCLELASNLLLHFWQVHRKSIISSWKYLYKNMLATE